MPSHTDTLRQLLAQGPLTGRQLQERSGLSQPTVSRALQGLGNALLRLGSGRATCYSLRDPERGLGEPQVYRVDAEGRLAELGRLVPVKPQGFVMQTPQGLSRHSEGLPWWLADMRPQGFLGRAFAQRHAGALGLPPALGEWSDTQVLRALLAHGQDAVGNLLLGEWARERFLSEPAPPPIARAARPAAYARLAALASAGDLPGSSAGGEQPKFSACVQRPAGPCQVLVKFSLADAHPVSQRWRDLLLAEHLALQTLGAAGIAVARSAIVEHGAQRFLELERFDRVGLGGRLALHSLGSLDDEFVGDRSAPWPEAVRRLRALGLVAAEVPAEVDRLYAFGQLIANSDMHFGNLSLRSEPGQPCTLAPAYDMLPMAFAPAAGGALRSELPPLRLAACVPHAVWAPMLELAGHFHAQLQRALAEGGLSAAFSGCVAALGERLGQARGLVERLG